MSALAVAFPFTSTLLRLIVKIWLAAAHKRPPFFTDDKTLARKGMWIIAIVVLVAFELQF